MKPSEALEDFLGRLKRAQREEWEKEVRNLRTPTDVKRWARRVRKWLIAGHGGFPERTPLKPRTVGVVGRKGYRIEKILFESRPEYLVPALVHVPEGMTPPFPAVVQACGHYEEAKAHPDYQRMAILLAMNGFVVCTPDPIGQGERGEYVDLESGVNVAGGAVGAHHFVYKPSLLLGRNVIHFRSWDKIRAIDLLCAREDVDAERIGFIGHSGGGQMTYLLCGLDDRIRAAAISSGSGSCEHPHFLPNVRGAHCIGDNLDYVAAYIPKPLQIMIGETERVYLDRMAGHRHLFDSLYKIFGKGDRFRVIVVEGGHDLDRPRRKQVAQWVLQWLQPAATFRDFDGKPEPVSRLQCTKTGNTRTSLKTETAVSLNSNALKDCARTWPMPRTPKELSAVRTRLRKRLRYLLALPTDCGPLGLKSPASGNRVEEISFNSERGRSIRARLYLPEAGKRRFPTVIFLDDRGMDQAVTGIEELRSRCSGLAVLALHVAGLGESASLPVGRYDHPMIWSPQTSLATCALKAGRPLIGMRVNDVLRAVDAVARHKLLDAHRVFVFGVGSGALWAAFAAALDARIRGVAAADMLLSYAQLVENRFIAGTYVADYLPQILKHADVAHILACIAPRPLTLFGSRDHLGTCAESKAQRSALAPTRRAYRIARASRHLAIYTGVSDHRLWDISMAAKWIHKVMDS